MNKISDKKNKKRIKRKKHNKKNASIRDSAKKKLAYLEKAIQSFPESCSSCNKEFMSTEGNLDAWTITTISGTLSLFCESCKSNVPT
jgi:hypothetical protein|tara:strand:- start:615 stop:875 length:261 start_codon:yes stop_codon:yes gene_type:complete